VHAYEEFVVTGTPDQARAFLAGWAAGQGLGLGEQDERVLLAKDRRIRSEGHLESLVETLRPGHVTHLVVREDAAEPLGRALAAGGRAAGVELRSRRRVRSASFEFEYEIFTKEEGALVRTVFEGLPEGVTLSEDYRPRESIDPKAAGVELYAPAHAYTLAARGTAHGPLEGILELHRSAARHERIRAKDIVIELEV
jgi:hypothetical protein